MYIVPSILEYTYSKEFHEPEKNVYIHIYIERVLMLKNIYSNREKKESGNPLSKNSQDLFLICSIIFSIFRERLLY